MKERREKEEEVNSEGRMKGREEGREKNMRGRRGERREERGVLMRNRREDYNRSLSICLYILYLIC